jgi:hypothetical protein
MGNEKECATERCYRTEKTMEKSKAVRTESYQWKGKNYDIAFFENPDSVSVQAFLGDKAVSNCIHILILKSLGSDEDIDKDIAIAKKAVKGDVQNGIHEKHNTP